MMEESFEVYVSKAFRTLSQEVNRFGAMYLKEANKVFKEDFVQNAIGRKILATRTTSVGELVYLLHQGRKLAGLSGAAYPTDIALENSVCLRQAVQSIENQGVDVDLTIRKYSGVFKKSEGLKVLLVARAKGYTFQGLRVMRNLILKEEYDQVLIYSYQSQNKLQELAKPIYEPSRASTCPVDRNKLILKTIKPLQ